MIHDGPHYAIRGQIQRSERCLFIRDSMPIDGGWFRCPVVYCPCDSLSHFSYALIIVSIRYAIFQNGCQCKTEDCK